MLNVNLKGEGTIDNVVIYLEDPKEKMPYFLKPKSNREWERVNLSIPLVGDLDYSLYVLAFSGTKFTCIITNNENDKTIVIEGVTGRKIKNQAHETGSEEFK